MRLRITTPLDVLLDADGVTSLRAEDASGSFGIWPGHADFLTRLSVSVVGWTLVGGAHRYCAVRRGVLTIFDGRTIEIATLEGVLGDELATLDRQVLQRFRSELETERIEHVASAQLQLAAVRQMMRSLGPSGARAAGNFT